MAGVGVPGGKRQRTAGDRAHARAYRNSPAGRLERKMYLMGPEVKAKMALRRHVKAHMKGRA